jgi:U3 small nucleolar RNA-associated protein 6
MERVTYQLERSLPSLDLLATSGVFSRDELRALTSQRQQHESHLIRRVALWEDFKAYIAFEEKTEKLRLLRCRGLGEFPISEASSQSY